MVREPAMGRVKTRLAREAGAVAAIRFYRANVRAVVGRLARDPRWRTLLAVDPDRATASRALPSAMPRMPQGPGGLGARMQRIMDRVPPGPAIIVGTDIPGIRPAHVAQAFRGLGWGSAALGPTPDGGYWLVGLGRTPRVARIFAGVRWSSEHALADTLVNLKGARAVMAARLGDVDGAGDLAAVRSAVGRRVLPAG